MKDMLKAIKMWYEDEKGSDLWKVGGLAGTGKTTLIKEVHKALGIPLSAIEYAAYTGKAADVMRRKGVDDAVTIHSLMYKPLIENEVLVGFEKRGIDLSIKLVIIDEASMVSEEIYNDLSKERVKILYVGDHGQLPPVKSEFNLMAEEELDGKLTEIHRQDKDSGIVDLALEARKGNKLKNGKYGVKKDAVVKDSIGVEFMIKADQIICGRNATRSSINELYREFHGYKKELELGEKIIVNCNNRDFGVYNGQQFIVLNKYMGVTANCKAAGPLFGKKEEKLIVAEPHVFHKHKLKLGLKYSQYDSRLIKAFPAKFGNDYAHKGYAQIDYGYAITCHKSQGSEWDKVVVLNEAYAFREHSKRWLYTAITRAAKKVFIVKDIN
jgi:exodeoxyribonuclease V